MSRDPERIFTYTTIAITVFSVALICFLLALFTMGHDTVFSLVGWIFLIIGWTLLFLGWKKK